MKTALHTIASVSAICSAISMTPALCLRNATSMGWRLMSVSLSSIGLQLPGRLYTRGTECGIDAGQYCGHHGNQQGQQQQRYIETCKARNVFGKHPAHAVNTNARQQQSKHTATKTHDGRFHQKLRINRGTRRAQCTAHTNLIAS